MKVNSKVLVPVGLLATFGIVFHFIPTFFKKPESDKPKSLGDILKSLK